MDEEVKNALEIAEEALTNGEYDPFERAQDRGYPEVEVAIYWDEVAARKLVDHNLVLERQANKIAVFNNAVAAATKMIDELNESDEGYKDTLSQLKKAQTQDAKSAKEAQVDYDKLEADGQALKDELEKSKVTLGLSGFPNKVIEAIRKKLNVEFPATGEQNEAWDEAYGAEIVSAAIRWTQKFGEEKSTQHISPAVVAKWRNSLPAESYEKLVRATGEVTLATGFFKSLEDAGFLAKS